MPAQARFGERIPVPVTTFTPIATGGTPQQPIISYNYENIGVNIDITPRTHHDDEVTLALKVEVQSISGTGFGGLPTFANREINTVIRLRDGETNMLAGLIRDDERTRDGGYARPERSPARRADFRALANGDDADRHHPDADAAHRPRARCERTGSARVPGGSRFGGAGLGASDARRDRRATAEQPAPRTGAPHPSRRCNQHSRHPTAAGAAPRPAQPAPTQLPSNAACRPAARSDFLDVRSEPAAAARQAARSRARRFRAATSRLSPSAASAAAISAMPGPEIAAVERTAEQLRGPVTMMRCGSHRNRSARMPLSCSSANSRSSYSQSWTSVRPSACVASTVTRLTRSLGKPGHSPVVIRPAACGRRLLDAERRRSHRALHVQPLQHGGDDFHVLGSRAADIDFTLGDGSDNRPTARLDVVAPQPMLRAPCNARPPSTRIVVVPAPVTPTPSLRQELAELDDVRLARRVADF